MNFQVVFKLMQVIITLWFRKLKIDKLVFNGFLPFLSHNIFNPFNFPPWRRHWYMLIEDVSDLKPLKIIWYSTLRCIFASGVLSCYSVFTFCSDLDYKSTWSYSIIRFLCLLRFANMYYGSRVKHFQSVDWLLYSMIISVHPLHWLPLKVAKSQEVMAEFPV